MIKRQDSLLLPAKVRSRSWQALESISSHPSIRHLAYNVIYTLGNFNGAVEKINALVGAMS